MAEKKKLGRMQGYLTVYLALSMTVLLSLYLALIEGARSNAIRLETECVMDIAMNSVMAEYHRELYKQYNLFAIDTSYGTAFSGMANVEAHMREYLEKNVSTEDIFLEKLLYRDFLAMNIENAEMTKVSILTDGQGEVFRRRAVEAIKDDVGLSLMEDLAEWTKTVKDYDMLERNIASEKESIDAEIQEYDGMEIRISEKEWYTVEIDNPTDELERIRDMGVLHKVINNPLDISGKSISTEQLIGARMNAGVVNRGNWQKQELATAEQLAERFLFQEYLVKYLGCYGSEDETNALEYQLEYLIAGEDSDIKNLRSVVDKLCMLREVANVIYLYSDENKYKVAEALATILAALMRVPEITDLLTATLLLGWAYAESLYDVSVILSGGKIPLVKDKDTWYLDLETALQIGGGGIEVSDVGLCYEDYLRIFMSFLDEEALTTRAMDMVEADIRETPGNSAFRLDACYDCIEANVRIKSDYGYTFEISRQKKY